MTNWREVTKGVLCPMWSNPDWRRRTDDGAAIALVLRGLRRTDAVRWGSEGGRA